MYYYGYNGGMPAPATGYAGYGGYGAGYGAALWIVLFILLVIIVGAGWGQTKEHDRCC